MKANFLKSVVYIKNLKANFSVFPEEKQVLNRLKMVICSLLSDAKWWKIVFEANFSFCSQNRTRNWTFDKFNLFMTSEASFKEGETSQMSNFKSFWLGLLVQHEARGFILFHSSMKNPILFHNSMKNAILFHSRMKNAILFHSSMKNTILFHSMRKNEEFYFYFKMFDAKICNNVANYGTNSLKLWQQPFTLLTFDLLLSSKTSRKKAYWIT